MDFIGEAISFIWNNFFYNPILNVLIVMYEIGFQNLGIAVILLTLVVRLATMSLTKNQMENAQKIQEIRPELEKLQKKYKKDPVTFQKKQQELYKKIGYNPLGCFSTFLVQLPIIIALYRAVRNFSEGIIEGIYPFIQKLFNLGEKVAVKTGFLFWDLAVGYNEVSQEFGRFSKEALPYIALAVLVGFAQYLSTRFVAGSRPKPQMKKAKKKAEGELDPTEMMGSMNKSMLITMPVIIGITSLSLPSVLSLYWICSSIVQVVQQWIIGDREFIIKKIKIRWDEFIHRKPKSKI